MRWFGRLFGGACALLLASPALCAEGPWQAFEGGRLRLVTLAMPDGGLQGGFQIDLEEGWKTYWRAPGGSGLPPQIDLSGSRNVASSAIRFPVPKTSRDPSGLTAVYDGDVTFPIDVTRLFTGRDVTLSARGVIGVCREICVPVPFATSVTHDAHGGTSFAVASDLAKARSGLPEPARAALRVERARIDADTLHVTARVPQGAGAITLFPDGPANWYLAPAEPVSLTGGAARFELPVPKNRVAGARGTSLRFLLKADGRGVTQSLAVE